ncbi:MAG: D-alanyl-D-alanine carboxypeptidase [Rhodobiaceae bacterium]|nr:D-alanyl-D-alanine carboxypeptidase [Rhodobiaceae bacterium]MCC0056879.1 D-alanyl-D-alanine carboxypeptidase [Rhodobiaceae bacterium]
MAGFLRAFIVFATLCAAGPAFARPALVIDAATGEVLHSHEATRLWYPASITKVMTTYVALSAVRSGRISMDTQLTVTQRALNEPPSKTGMPVGSTLSLEQALRIIMVKSANDTAVTIAEGVGGSVESFVAEMNRTARALGMRDTNYVNPNGLPDSGQITTARDQALLAQAIYRDFPRYTFLFSLDNVKIGGRTFRNHNSLIGRYPGADGLKTGFICDSGFNLVASVQRNGRRLIGVVFGAENTKIREDVMVALIESGFDNSGGLLFRSRKATAESLPSTGQPPFVMRDHVCGPKKQRTAVSGEIASWGLSARQTAIASVADPARQIAASGGGVIGNLLSRGEGDDDSGADNPVRYGAVPMPERNPLRR